MEDIMELARSEAMLFKFGSGTGTDLSTLRSHREKLSGGGKPSGPLSFMRVYDQIAAVVKRGGKTRRAAKMQSLKVWHPDILEFIECKWKEEKKARTLIAEGYEANFNGEAYSSVLFQNANLSVRVTDEFMEAVENGEPLDHALGHRTPSGEPPDLRGPRAAARGWPTAPGTAAIRACSTTRRSTAGTPARTRAGSTPAIPCSRVHVPRRLGLQPGEHQPDEVPPRGRHVRRRAVHGGLPAVLHRPGNPGRPRQLSRRTGSPTNSHLFRPLGLGYSNLGSLIMAGGLPYDSDAARGLCGAITALLHGAANLTSAEMAGAVGPFEGYAENREPMLRVMEMHCEAVEEINDAGPQYLKDAARELWDEVLVLRPRHGFRNAQATVLAPTGTISFMMDCDTTGIEPDIALVKYKQLAGGGMLKIVNQTVPLALRTLGYDEPQIAAIIELHRRARHDRGRRRT